MGSFGGSRARFNACSIGIICAVLLGVLGIGAPTSAGAQIDSYSVYLQEGGCSDLADLPESAPQAVATPSQSSGEALTSTSLTFDVDSSFADLLATPVSLLVDANRSEVGTTIACGELSAPESGNQAVVPIVSVETGALVGIGVLRPASDTPHVIVEIYLVVSPDGAPISATATAEEADNGQDVADDDEGSDAPEDEPEGGV